MRHVLSRALALTAACVLFGAAAPALANPPATSYDYSEPQLLSPTSLWNTEAGYNAPVAPTSQAQVTALADDIAAKQAGGLYPGIAWWQYSTPVYIVPAGQPHVPVTMRYPNTKFALVMAAQGAPIPPGATPAAGTDAHLTVWQPSSDTLWEFWKASLQSDGWHADWGGAMQPVSTNPGWYSNTAYPGLTAGQGWDWGASATSLPIAAGRILVNELRAGKINHTLSISLPSPCSGWFVHPAQRTDGTSTASTCIPEGARLRLPATMNLSALGLPASTYAIARAIQKYGAIVHDRTGAGGSVSLYAQTVPAGEPSPYTGPEQLFNGMATWQVLQKFPWRSLQVLAYTPCTTHPC